MSCHQGADASGLGADFYALERERRLMMECCRLQQELLHTQSLLARAETERDALSQQVSNLQTALDSRSASSSSSASAPAAAVDLEASNRQLVKKLHVQQQFWVEKLEDVLLRAAVDLNRQGRELRKQICGAGASAGKPRLETPRSSAASSPTATGEPMIVLNCPEFVNCASPRKRVSESGSEIVAAVAGMSMDQPNRNLRHGLNHPESMKKRKNPVSPYSLLIAENVMNCGSACDTVQRTVSTMSDNSYQNPSDIADAPHKEEHYVQTSPTAHEEEAEQPEASNLGPHALLAHIKSFARRRTK